MVKVWASMHSGTLGAVSGSVPCSRGTSAVPMGLNWQVSSDQSTLHTRISHHPVPRPNLYRLSHCRPQLFDFYCFLADEKTLTLVILECNYRCHQRQTQSTLQLCVHAVNSGILVHPSDQPTMTHGTFLCGPNDMTTQ